ncbi:MAG: hypothetical protein AMXMBFR61_17780 [Fimbriimonadales bacterium]
MDRGRLTLAVVAPALLALAFPCPTQPWNVHILGDGQVGGLYWEPTLEMEMCEFQFIAEGVPWIPTGCGVEYDWTFSGCGAEPSSSAEPNPLVRFSEPGVCRVSVTVRALEGPNCQPGEGSASGRYYVIGGPFDVELQFPLRNSQHDRRDPSRAWYLAYWGVDPAQPSWPAYLQPPICARITARYQQPQGDDFKTTYEWTYPVDLLFMMGGENNGTELARTAEFYARGPSAESAITVTLSYVFWLLQDGIWTPIGSVGDDSDFLHAAGANYRKFTSHKPAKTRFVEASLLLCTPPPPPDQPMYRVEQRYLYCLYDHLGYRMPDTWVNERFPNGVPEGFRHNTLSEYWWTRYVGGDWDEPPIGHFFRFDILGASSSTWIPFPSDPPIFGGPILQEYWAGSKAVEPGFPGGCQVGVREMRFWTDKISHTPADWP